MSMTFKEALEYLGIEEYSERIFNSNSHGELFHLVDYIKTAEYIKQQIDEGGVFGSSDQSKLKIEPGDLPSQWFPQIVHKMVEIASTWRRPESVFQHLTKFY